MSAELSEYISSSLSDMSFITSASSWRFFAVASSAACFLRHFVRRFWNQTWKELKLKNELASSKYMVANLDDSSYDR